MIVSLALVAALSLSDRIDFPRVAWRCASAFGAPTVAEGAVYSGGHRLFRLDPASGEVLAEVGRAEEGETESIVFGGAPAVGDGRVIARRTDGGVAAYDLELSKKLWSRAGAGKGYAFPGQLAGEAYFFADGWSVVALDVRDGAERWRRALPGEVNMTPAVSEGVVLVGTNRGVFQALDRDSGEPVWTVEELGEFGWTHPVARDGVVYVGDRGRRDGPGEVGFNQSTIGRTGSRSGALHAFDVRTGDHRWGRTFGATGLSRPFVAENGVFAGFGRYVARFDLESGEIDEETPVFTGANAFGSPTVVGGRLYFGNLDGHLYVHDLTDGALDWAFAVPEAQVADFVHTGDRVFVSTTKGLFALAPGERGKGGRTLVWQGE